MSRALLAAMQVSALLRMFALLALLVPMFGTACSSTGGDDDFADRLSLSSVEEALILDFVNYPGTDHHVLDQLVPLDRRAAENIIEHRNGLDGITPSADDVLFEGIEDLLAVTWVGPVSVTRIQAYAEQNPPPAGEVVKGVAFKGWQAEIVVWGVNQASVGVLKGTGLNTTQATNLVEAAPFTSVAQMGAVSQIGPVSLERLRYAAPSWWHARVMYGGDSSAGTHAGVTFDHETAVVALDIANEATFAQLTGEGEMWSTGATRIIDNRPYTGLGDVADVWGIGTTTMQSLHDYAAAGIWTAPDIGPGADCATAADCAEGLACVGIPWDGSPLVGKCADLSPIPGNGDDCIDQTCGDGMFCSGLTLWNDFGMCRPDWKAGTYTSTNSVSIPDAGAGTATSSVVVYGLATVPLDIVATLDIDHPRPSDLIVTLHHSAGTSAVLWNQESNPSAEVIVHCCIERDYYVNGTYTLEIVDTQGGETGTLNGFSLWVTSRYD
jgi:DNA uptake protein ComE-like DNA-binding protein